MDQHILVVDDDPLECQLLQDHVARLGYLADGCTSGQEALQHVQSHDYDMVLTDYFMADMNGTTLCTQLSQLAPELPVVIMTGHGTMDIAIEAIRCGAYDFLQKPLDHELMRLALRRAMEHSALQKQVRNLQEALQSGGRFGEIIGESPPMRTMFELLTRLASSEVTVLITGETGCGKELVARALHDMSPRSAGPFVALNCAAVPHNLLESELFGHRKGAFTDAHTDRQGLFIKANKGTLYLDEIGEMPMSLQPKLLRVLEERVLRPIGSDTEISFDTRIVAATNRDLLAEAEEERFRRDLYFRINVVNIAVPPLRARGNDILLLAQHFVESFAKQKDGRIPTLSRAFVDRLLAYPWPGNVRELRNAMERAVTLAPDDDLRCEVLPPVIANYREASPAIISTDPGTVLPLAEVELQYIQHILQRTGGNKTEAARLLQMDRKTLHRKIEGVDGKK